MGFLDRGGGIFRIGLGDVPRIRGRTRARDLGLNFRAARFGMVFVF